MTAKYNLYLITQTQNEGYDTYDSAVVAAGSALIAKRTHPSGYYRWGKNILGDFCWVTKKNVGNTGYTGGWCDNPDHVRIQMIGIAATDVKEGVICSSYNAG